MTRGNQRDLARAKNQKKQQELAKAKGAAAKSGVSTDKRLDRDAEIMRKKQEAAAAAKEQANEAGTTKKVVKIDPLKDL